MADYFTDFWLITTDGRKLYPARQKDRETGRETYRTLGKGSNEKADGRQYDDAVDAIGAFLRGASLRFGAPGHTTNRFDLHGPKTARVGATAAFLAANPTRKI